VTARGYRSVRGLRVDESLDVTLEPVPVSKVEIRLRDGALLPEPPYGLNVELAWVGPIDGEDDESRWSDPHTPMLYEARIGRTRQLTVEAWEPGRYLVILSLVNADSESAWDADIGMEIGTVPDEPIVTIRGDGAPVTIEIAMDEGEFERRRGD